MTGDSAMDDEAPGRRRHGRIKEEPKEDEETTENPKMKL